MTYSQKLKDPRWQKKRLEIMDRDKFTCVHCKDKETTLNVHHKKYTGDPWEAPDSDLETICEDCHSIIHKLETAGIDNILKINKIKGDLIHFHIYRKDKFSVVDPINNLITIFGICEVKNIIKILEKLSK